MDIHLNFPQDKWTPWRSLPPTDFPLLPLPFPIAKLSKRDQADENMLHFIMREIHTIYCDQSPVRRVNPETKPFLAMLLHVYTVCGDIKEELHDTIEKLTKMAALLQEINRLIVEDFQRAPGPNPAANCLSKAITTWRRKKMFITALKRQEPLLLEVARIGRELEFLKGWKDKSVLDISLHVDIKIEAISRIVMSAEEQMNKIYLPENQFARNDLVNLELPTFMVTLKRALWEHSSLLTRVDSAFSRQCRLLEHPRLANNTAYENLKSSQSKLYLRRLGFKPKELNEELYAAFMSLPDL